MRRYDDDAGGLRGGSWMDGDIQQQQQLQTSYRLSRLKEARDTDAGKVEKGMNLYEKEIEEK